MASSPTKTSAESLFFVWCRRRAIPADVFVGEEAIGSLVLDEDEEDDERSYNFEVKITLGDATTTAPDLK